jgi:2-isopropylmalate synthase
VEGWTLEYLQKMTEEAIGFAVKEGLQVMYVTEDTTRADPESLRVLFTAAIRAGASRLCIADTVGHATPQGTRAVVSFIRGVVDATGEEVAIDWHGHNDRGLALENALWALEFGADRVHGTALGIGERVGNAQMELILLNLKLLGLLEDQDLTKLLDYCNVAATAVGWDVPINYPLVGRDAFRTATGVHAAAIIKAKNKGDEWLADRVYSGVPAGMFGRTQEICVGYMSGASNVAYWLRSHDIEPTDAVVAAILKKAKSEKHILSDEEIMAVVNAG